MTSRTLPGNPELSIIVPAFDEAEALRHTIPAIVAEVETTGRSFELLVVDDGSRDGTGALLWALSGDDARIVPVTLARNFGKEAAMQAGLDAARGRAAILMDADLQHPPSLIPEMVRMWEAGHAVVDGVKVRRARESAPRRMFAALFNRLLGKTLPVGADFGGASDFKLLDREVIEALCACPERGRFFRGLVAWVGFRHGRVEFECAERAGGRTKWRPGALLRYSLGNLMAFSSAPLRAVAVAGFGVVLLGTLLALQTLWRYFAGEAVTGFTTVIVVMVIFSGAILLALGVIALYLAQMYEEQKARPLYVLSRNAPAAQRTARGHDAGVAVGNLGR